MSFDIILFVFHLTRMNVKFTFLLCFLLIDFHVKGKNALENFKDPIMKAIFEIAENLDGGKSFLETLLFFRTWDGMELPVSNKECIFHFVASNQISFNLQIFVILYQ